MVKCPLCDFETDNIHTLFGHMLQHCDEDGYFVVDKNKPKQFEEKSKTFKCFFCSEEFHDFDELVKHLVTLHMDGLCALSRSTNKTTAKGAKEIIRYAQEKGYIKSTPPFQVEEKKEEEAQQETA